jgi:hypothetical protein
MHIKFGITFFFSFKFGIILFTFLCTLDHCFHMFLSDEIFGPQNELTES